MAADLTIEVNVIMLGYRWIFSLLAQCTL